MAQIAVPVNRFAAKLCNVYRNLGTRPGTYLHCMFLRVVRVPLRLLRKGLTVFAMGHAGTAIRELRKAQGLSLRELARLADVEPGYLSTVERGLRDPSPRWLKAVTDALGKHLGGAA